MPSDNQRTPADEDVLFDAVSRLVGVFGGEQKAREFKQEVSARTPKGAAPSDAVLAGAALGTQLGRELEQIADTDDTTTPPVSAREIVENDVLVGVRLLVDDPDASIGLTPDGTVMIQLSDGRTTTYPVGLVDGYIAETPPHADPEGMSVATIRSTDAEQEAHGDPEEKARPEPVDEEEDPETEHDA